MTERPDLTDLTSEQIAPLEALVSAWPESWQDFARSHYLTLLAQQPDRSPQRLATCARLAADLAQGIARDMGGAQPYINVGTFFAADEKASRIVLAWRAGQPWQAIARVEGVTERRVRQIVEAWKKEVFARIQGTQSSLPLEDA
ncbi:Mor transcription activator family protein [Delftia tsuruhatensis]|uniref:Mor transcription activator family protein n=1 Tax=Delftia tsuruhatensis TaxID=180282 RepID=UPI00202980FC|nr:Mor transcription activator family protein [Delftia tsuruhatensis]